MKRALFVGIDNYRGSPLHGCVADARSMASLLGRNEDNSRNYTTRLVDSMDEGSQPIDRAYLRASLAELFDNAGNSAQLLFYFAGHGAESSWGAELVTQDFVENSLGVSMNDVVTLANTSTASEIVIILDCCYSGDIGNLAGLQSDSLASQFRLGKAVIREGVTLLAASRATSISAEFDNHGAFTQLLLEGLEGAAADHIGNVTALSLYDFASRAFNDWEQRPIFKSHIAQPSVLRVCKPAIHADLLRQLIDFFPTAVSRIQMTPAYEGQRPILGDTKPTKEQKAFDYFKQLRNAGLLATNDNQDLYFVALLSEEVFLTASGKYFWRLAKEGKL